MKGVNKIGTFAPDNLIAGNQVPLLIKSIELETGTGVLKRGTVISISGKIANCTKTGTESNITTTYDKVDGILTDDVELSEFVKINAAIYISGEFNSNFMAVGADATIKDFERELRTLGIFVK